MEERRRRYGQNVEKMKKAAGQRNKARRAGRPVPPPNAPANGLLLEKLVPVAARVLACRTEVGQGVRRLLQAYPFAFKCSACPEVFIGPQRCHNIRTCRGRGSQMVKGCHQWVAATSDDLLEEPEVYHLSDRVLHIVQHEERFEVPRISAVLEICIQAGIDIPDYPTVRRTTPLPRLRRKTPGSQWRDAGVTDETDFANGGGGGSLAMSIEERLMQEVWDDERSGNQGGFDPSNYGGMSSAIGDRYDKTIDAHPASAFPAGRYGASGGAPDESREFKGNGAIGDRYDGTTSTHRTSTFSRQNDDASEGAVDEISGNRDGATGLFGASSPCEIVSGGNSHFPNGRGMDNMETSEAGQGEEEAMRERMSLAAQGGKRGEGLWRSDERLEERLEGEEGPQGPWVDDYVARKSSSDRVGAPRTASGNTITSRSSSSSSSRTNSDSSNDHSGSRIGDESSSLKPWTSNNISNSSNSTSTYGSSDSYFGSSVNPSIMISQPLLHSGRHTPVDSNRASNLVLVEGSLTARESTNERGSANYVHELGGNEWGDKDGREGEDEGVSDDEGDSDHEYNNEYEMGESNVAGIGVQNGHFNFSDSDMAYYCADGSSPGAVAGQCPVEEAELPPIAEDPDLVRVAQRTLAAWQAMRDGVARLMKKYPCRTCGYCTEVHVGQRGHKVRLCNSSKHQWRNGQHGWHKALIDDVIPPKYVWHLRGDPLHATPLQHELAMYYGMAPAVIELCVQMGAPIPLAWEKFMRLDVAVPEPHEIPLAI
eukprot:TRINITY_DN676_c0_g1_i1.p1 TRINITY_DN676_c0_g1~~TRINITY_DN676_c0_g1_i1.p1  ORF type:complete len:837 (+),score=104.99 TRINITY_DN676_c0_g1_i1:214-2511(+)